MKVVIYGTANCKFCDAAKDLCDQININYEYKDINEPAYVVEMTFLFPEARTVPQITVDEKPVGGYSEFKQFLGWKL